MPTPTQEQHEEFLGYWREQFNIHDVFVRISGAPKGYIGWAANRTMLETCIRKVGLDGEIEYNTLPAYPQWFMPAFGETPADTAREAVRLYEIDKQDPEASTRMNVGCLAVAEMLAFGTD
jgi:hypothetical protein